MNISTISSSTQRIKKSLDLAMFVDKILVGSALLAIGSMALDTHAESDCANLCPHGGAFDGGSCFVADAPPRSRPFVDGNEFYYSAVTHDPSGPCPGALEQPGAICRVGRNPPQAHPFVHDGRFYYMSACDQRAEWSEWVTHSNTGGLLAGRAAHRKIHLTWSLNSTSPEVTSITVIYGQAGASDKHLESLLPEQVKHRLLPEITRSSCRVGQALQELRAPAYPPRDPPICRNGGAHDVSAQATDAWLHRLRTNLTYRVEVELEISGEPEPHIIGPIFLRTR